MKEKIDFTITWVDPADPLWLQEKKKYAEKKDGDDRVIRYRDWDLLKYWFRGVEQFAPWVNKVHFVTWGHIPDWLNVNHPKLNIVKHEDFIPEKYLPTFNSRVIELNLHRIKGLSSHFVLFNDDMHLVNKVKESDFFLKGLPRHLAAFYLPNGTFRPGNSGNVANNMEIIHSHFNKRLSIKSNFCKWYNPFLSKKNFYSVLAMAPYSCFASFCNLHLADAYLKDTFSEVWEREEKELDFACNFRFRPKNFANIWLMKYW